MPSRRPEASPGIGWLNGRRRQTRRVVTTSDELAPEHGAAGPSAFRRGAQRALGPPSHLAKHQLDHLGLLGVTHVLVLRAIVLERSVAIRRPASAGVATGRRPLHRARATPVSVVSCARPSSSRFPRRKSRVIMCFFAKRLPLNGSCRGRTWGAKRDRLAFDTLVIPSHSQQIRGSCGFLVVFKVSVTRRLPRGRSSRRKHGLVAAPSRHLLPSCGTRCLPGCLGRSPGAKGCKRDSISFKSS